MSESVTWLKPYEQKRAENIQLDMENDVEFGLLTRKNGSILNFIDFSLGFCLKELSFHELPRTFERE